MKLSRIICLLGVGFGVAQLPTIATAQQLSIESWRNDDVAPWSDVIVPAFKAKNPGIDVTFSPTAASLYNSALNSKLAGGTAGDLISCRPFDLSLGLYQRGSLAKLNDLPGMENFTDRARGAWTTDDGKDSYCVPIASTMLGFVYNVGIFKELGLKPPTTEDEFMAVLEAIKKDGRYTPLAFGLGDPWVPALLAFHNIGPSYYKGEDGRKALIAGKMKLTDPAFVQLLEQVAKWRPYLADGYEVQKNSDSKQLFTLGRAAIYPSGSWDIASLTADADFELDAFPPPKVTADSDCYIDDHNDIGMGLNPASHNVPAARTFLSWIASPEFANLYSNSLPGFFSLSSAPITVDNKLAQTFASWRNNCKSTIRFSYQILSRGEPNLENEIFRVVGQVMRGAMTPTEGAADLQAGLDKWYKPQS